MFKFKFLTALWLVALVLVLTPAFSPLLLAQSVDVNAAKKEGKVIVYGTVVPQVMSQINKAFENKYGVRVEYWRGSATAVLDRATNEWNAGRPGFDAPFLDCLAKLRFTGDDPLAVYRSFCAAILLTRSIAEVV